MIRLVLMDETEFIQYQELDIPRYAGENVKAGNWGTDEALEKSRQTHSRLLPDGLKTKNHLFFKIVDEHMTRVGTLWLFSDFDAVQPTGFIYDLIIEVAFRRKGYGKQAMTALEGKARELGLKRLALHVFAHNLPARKLYQDLGYRDKSMNMSKEL